MYDILIKNAKIADGSGNPTFFADVAVKDGKIARICKNLKAEAQTVIDGKGKVLSPGFIDVHSHHDLELEKNYLCSNSLEQGITTIIGGMCGESAAPICADRMEDCLRVVGREHSEESYQARMSMEDYLNFVDQPTGSNMGYLVGHGNLRACVVGYADRKLTKEEQAEMEELLRKCMKAGALGLSFGLIYPPGSYADTEEMIGLAKVVAQFGGLVTSHMRSESAKLIEATDEMLQVARASGVRMVISHHKATGGPMNWNKTAATISMMNRAVEEGLDVFCDQYPYTASATGLQTNIPDELHVLGVEKLVEMLTTAEGREDLRPRICGSKDSWTRFQYTMIGNSKSRPEYAGRMLNDIAREEGKDPYDIQCDLLRDDRLGTGAIFHTMSEEDVERVMQWPRAMVGTDGQYAPGTAGGHPRSFATFPRVLGRYVREKKVITLENAIRKMCSLPAMVYNLPTKGLIREGMDADLVLFDPETIGDKADFAHPMEKNEGLNYVFVAGQIAVKDGVCTGVKAGAQLRLQVD